MAPRRLLTGRQKALRKWRGQYVFSGIFLLTPATCHLYDIRNICVTKKFNRFCFFEYPPSENSGIPENALRCER